jgi:predicted transglutaminase-like cysteine proteinase
MKVIRKSSIYWITATLGVPMLNNFLIIFLFTLITHVSLAQTSLATTDYRIIQNNDLSKFTKWTSVLDRYESQSDNTFEDCTKMTCAIKESKRKWGTLIKQLQGKSQEVQMSSVNNYFNNIKYINDIKLFGKTDYWQTPYEFINKGGDCEDYAIAKYFMLKRLGFSTDNLKIVINKDINLGGIAHSVLVVNYNNQELMLDNQIKNIAFTNSIFHYIPIYAINEKYWWLYKGKG